ncbi:MAG: sulfatase-like hydrolase/transferase [Planctomycetota bacterium]
MPDRPNILILMADQHSPRILGYYGDRVQTPHLDRLAAEGVTFDNAYCNSPLCVPSRMSFLTGQHCHQIGVWENGDALSSDIPTFLHSLGIAGYRTVLAGRMHFIGGDQMHGFLERAEGDITSGHLGQNRTEYRDQGHFGCRESLDHAGCDHTMDLEYDNAVTAAACRTIYNHRVEGDPRPLCLVVGYYSPHDPYAAPPEYYNRYAEGAELPPDWRGESVHRFTMSKIKQGQFDRVPEEKVLAARAAYRGKVNFLDDLVGRVLEAWRRTSMDDDAVTVYLSDHGDMLGEHGLWAKTSFYDPSAGIPMIWHGPCRLQQGKREGQVVSQLDVAPTLLEVAGAEPLPDARGQSFLPALTERSAPLPGLALSELARTGNGGPCRMVRHGKWKYNAYREWSPELYDMETDPGEMHNLADDPSTEKVRRELDDLVRADGWHPDVVAHTLHERKAGQAMITRWTQATSPTDPHMWGRPAPL